jgi:GH25 family lysozyme M1 (1,4-beta-N-acetylmuramidase)
MKISVFLLSLCFTLSLAVNGVDISTLVSTSAFGCLKSNGYTFAIMRCYRSTGSIDPNCASSVANAWAAGMAHVDVYLFPCFSCGNPAGQVSTLFNYLKSNNVRYGQIWLDIEGPGVYWGSSQSANANFFAAMASEARSLGINLGVYTSASQWNPIMGSYTGGSAFPLWYAHYDGVQSFADFAAFGGWTRPNIKVPLSLLYSSF